MLLPAGTYPVGTPGRGLRAEGKGLVNAWKALGNSPSIDQLDELRVGNQSLVLHSQTSVRGEGPETMLRLAEHQIQTPPLTYRRWATIFMNESSFWRLPFRSNYYPPGEGLDESLEIMDLTLDGNKEGFTDIGDKPLYFGGGDASLWRADDALFGPRGNTYDIRNSLQAGPRGAEPNLYVSVAFRPIESPRPGQPDIIGSPGRGYDLSKESPVSNTEPLQVTPGPGGELRFGVTLHRVPRGRIPLELILYFTPTEGVARRGRTARDLRQALHRHRLPARRSLRAERPGEAGVPPAGVLRGAQGRAAVSGVPVAPPQRAALWEGAA